MTDTKINPDLAVKSVGTYTSGLPKPSFSLNNPYWQMDRFDFLDKKVRPRYSGVDFLYASVWEINQPFDIVGALYVRLAVVNTARLNFLVVGIKAREQFRNKENHNEKGT